MSRVICLSPLVGLKSDAMNNEIAGMVTVKMALEDERVGYSGWWIRQLAEKKLIQGVKIGEGRRGQWLISLPSLLAYIEKMNDQGGSKHTPYYRRDNV